MNMSIDQVLSLLPILLPILAIQLGLMITALVHLLRHKAVKRGSVALWAVVIVLVNIIGPVLYFLIGREDA